MNKLLIGSVVLVAVAMKPVSAQENALGASQRPTVVNGTARDWQSNYQAESSKDYIRRRAQEQSAARRARIETMKWLGHSPSRPLVSATPFMSNPPQWVGVAPSGYWGSAFWSTRNGTVSPVRLP